MRKITQDAIRAFNHNYPFKRANTQVKTSRADGVSYTVMELHGHPIAEKFRDFNGTQLTISACGYLTPTTKERLNGLSEVSIYQRNYEWFLNGEPWNGERITVE